MPDIRPIRTDADLDAALAEVRRLMDLNPAAGSDDLDHLDVLATLVEAYEAKHHPIDLPDPISAIEFNMEQFGISRRTLCSVAHISESKLSEVLARKRPLSITMMRNIGPILRIPLDVLGQHYEISAPDLSERKPLRKVVTKAKSPAKALAKAAARG